MASKRALNPCFEFLKGITCREICPREGLQILFIRTSDDLEHAVSALSSRGYLGAPVLNAANQCIGFLDMMDVCSYLVGLIPAPGPDRALNIDQAFATKEIYCRTLVQDVMDASGRDPFVTVFQDNPLSRVAELFQTGIKRVIVFNDKNDVCGFITPTDLIKLLWNELAREKPTLKLMKSLSLVQLGRFGSVVPQISCKALLVDAVKRLSHEGVGALALINDADGTLVGNFSARDLRGIYLQNLPRFTQQVDTYLRSCSPKSLSPLLLSPYSSFYECIQRFKDEKVHQFWICNASAQPIGMITQHDIMRILCQYQQPLAPASFTQAAGVNVPQPSAAPQVSSSA